ncbi:MAG: GGDEF domain-containing protein [Fimbriimonadaceae bacterium]|nr:GGDEF domain-containing protein [Alphaproteobacteria bacterium]
MKKNKDFERTIQFGEKALRHLRANIAPAYPRNYELWFTYVAGFNRKLNEALNDAIRKYGQVPEEAMDEIYDEFLSPSRITDRVEAVNSKFIKEFEHLMETLDDASESTSDYGKSLSNASHQLTSANGREQINLIVSRLIESTREMEERSKDLEDKLASSRQQIDVLHETLEAVRTESMTDALTGIANRKRFDQTLQTSILEAIEIQEPLALIFGDIDHFKKFNDTFGHQTGDQVLRLVSHALRSNVKGRDLAARYGGEEFAIILPHTDVNAAQIVANQIREAIMAKELVKKSTGESLGTITMSFGIAIYRAGEDGDSFISRADTALYAAKRAGRNCVITEFDPQVNNIEDVA